MGLTTTVMLLLVVTIAHAWSSKQVCRRNAWLEKPCAAPEDCKVKMSECFKGRCLCTPGFYYSIRSNTCVTQCSPSDLSDSYLTYLDSFLHSSLAYYEQESELTADSLQNCSALCLSQQLCHSFGFLTGIGLHACLMFDVIAADVIPTRFSRVFSETFSHVGVQATSTFYQRKCA
ncbi:uncharacterized protein [Littorina saxatilis]|uniref:Apple domain-containing protein n=1 Tax=Littorina saxatilis TaxID=31220 RepID=A0AAN9BPQ1_9CAEN